MTPASKALGQFLISILEPPDSRTIVQWAEDEIWLSERQTQNPGPISIGLIPYYAEIIDCFSDPEVSDITVVAGTQTGKTTATMIGVAWRLCNMPTPTIWVLPTEPLARSFSQTRLRPMLEDSESLKALMPTAKNKIKDLEMHFDRCTLTLVGSNSPANLASRPAGLLIMDELDKFADQNNKEASALALAENRTKSFVSPLRVKTSTPTIKTGPIWQEYLKGTQESFMLECPHCQRSLELKWEQVKWDQDAKDSHFEWNLKKVKVSAYYECQGCQGRIDDAMKAQMVAQGKWVAKNKNAPSGVRSFHLPSLYSLQKSCTFGALAVQFIQQLESHNLRDFINSTLAEPWEVKAASVTKTEVREVSDHSPEYLLGQIPNGTISALIMTVDVQQTCFWFIIRCWYSDGSSALIEYGQAINWQELVDLSNKQFPILGSDKTVQCLFCLIDSGYAAARKGGVYDFCLSGLGAGRFSPCQGRGAGYNHLKTVSESDQEHKGIPFKLMQFSDDVFKTELYVQKIKERVHNNWWLPRNLGRDYEEQLTDEFLTEKKDPRGQTMHVWETRESNNHLGDCEKMQLLLPALMGKEVMGALANKMEPAYGKVS